MLLVRPANAAGNGGNEVNAALRACRELILGTSSAMLGIRENDVLCLVRVADDSDYERLIRAAHDVAARSESWMVCLGRPHDGLEGVPRSFREAQEAASVALSRQRRGGAILFSDILLDRVLLHSEHTGDLLEEVIGPLLAYDARHDADLVPTLRAYVAHDFNMTRTAKELHVNPNTVAYRVRRIGQLSHQDATTAHGLVSLSLALRLFDG